MASIPGTPKSVDLEAGVQESVPHIDYATESGRDEPGYFPSPGTVSPASPPPDNHGLADQTNLLPARQVITVFLGLSLSLMCSYLDQTIVATALPRISADLHSGRESSWVATAYLLTSLAFTPLCGRWSDIFGRKVIFIGALVIFWVFSLACALSQTMVQLIIFRAFQGIGGGAMANMVFIIISDIVSLKDRGKYQAINEVVSAVGNGVGPILGGVLSQDATWRWAFYINLPLGAIAIVVAVWLLPLKRVRGDIKSKLAKVDYLGSVLTIVSSVLILLGLSWAGVTFPWASAPVITTLVLGLIVSVSFMLWEAYRAPIPIVPVYIFKNRTVVGVYICTVMTGITFFAILYFLPQFLQVVRGNTPIASSLLLVPFLAPIGLCVIICGQITARTGHYRTMIIVGFGVWSIGMGLLSSIDAQTSNGRIIGTLLLSGIASGGCFQTSLVAAQAAVPRRDMAVVTGVRNFLRLLGSTLALAVSATIVNNELRASMAPLHLTMAQINDITNDPTSIHSGSFPLGDEARQLAISGYQKGFRSVFYMALASTIIAFLSSVFIIQHHSLDREDDKQQKAATKEWLEQRNRRRSSQSDKLVSYEKPASDAV